MISRLKVGGYAILDENNFLNLKEYAPVKVRIVSKEGYGKYGVVTVEPLLELITNDGYTARPFVVDKKYLTPCTFDEHIVIRKPINTPAFSQTDELALEEMISNLESGKGMTQIDLMRLKAVLMKIKYANHFAKIEVK